MSQNNKPIESKTPPLPPIGWQSFRRESNALKDLKKTPTQLPGGSILSSRRLSTLKNAISAVLHESTTCCSSTLQKNDISARNRKKRRSAAFADRNLLLTSPCNFEAMLPENGVRNIRLLPPIEEQQVETTPEKKVKSTRFRRIAKKVMTNALWVKDVSDKTNTVENNLMEEGEGLTFDVNAFRTHIKSSGRLSSSVIEILMKPTEIRSEQEIKIIQKVVYNLSCFDRYLLRVKQELARIIHYEKFEDGRLIVKQGHPGSSFYFIISGFVVVERTELDPVTETYYSQRVGELQAGECFGELALLHNSDRAASIICRGTSEFLRVDKPDFDEVLRQPHQREWEMRVNFLNTHPVFKGWSTKELTIANGHSKVKIYQPNKVIVSGKKIQSDRVYFILHGTCEVVRRLDLVKKFISKDKYKYVLPSIDNASFIPPMTPDSFRRLDTTYTNEMIPCRRLQPFHNGKKRGFKEVKETRYFSITELNVGDFFNVGECMDGLYVMSKGRTTIAQVGKIAFSRHHGGRLLEEMKRIYVQKLPTFSDAYNEFISDRKWTCYKKTLVKNIIDRKPVIHSLNIKDIPGVVNKEQVYYLSNENII